MKRNKRKQKLVFHGIIYKITNLINGKLYIGQTIRNLDDRVWQHKNCADGNRVSYPLYLAIRKYGINNFKFEEIDGANSQSELNYKEWLYTLNYKTHISESGYNIKIGVSGKIITKEGREKQIKTLIEQSKRKRKVLDSKTLSERALKYFKDPYKKEYWYHCNGSRWFNVYKAIRISWPKGARVKGQKGSPALFAKGEYVGSWLTTTECAKDLGMKNGDKISSVLNGKRSQASNYIFELKNNNNNEK